MLYELHDARSTPPLQALDSRIPNEPDRLIPTSRLDVWNRARYQGVVHRSVDRCEPGWRTSPCPSGPIASVVDTHAWL